LETGAYGLAATVTAVWLMRDLPGDIVAAAILPGVLVALGMSAYGRRLADRR